MERWGKGGQRVMENRGRGSGMEGGSRIQGQGRGYRG